MMRVTLWLRWGAGLDGETRQLGSAEGPWPALPLGVWCCTGCLAWGWCRTGHSCTEQGEERCTEQGRRLHSTGLSWIIVLVFTQRSPVEMYEKGDSCFITALSNTRTSELVSSNMRGQFKTWDLRSNYLSSLQPGCGRDLPSQAPHTVTHPCSRGRVWGAVSMGPEETQPPSSQPTRQP